MRFFAALLGLAFLLTPNLRADSTDELLKIVPRSTSICIVVKDLKGHSKAILDSPFAQWFPDSAFGKSLGADDGFKKLLEAKTQIPAMLGTTFEAIRDDLFGDAVVLAYQPGSSDKPDSESGVLLLKARDPGLLSKLVKNFNDTQEKSGELKKLNAKRSGDREYIEREKSNGSKEYYFSDGQGLFAVSMQESGLLAVLAELAKSADQPLFAKSYAKLDASKSAVALLFDPRSFDAEMESAIKSTSNANDAAFRKQLRKLWSAFDAVCLTLDFDKDAALSLRIALDEKTLPDGLKPLFAPALESSALWSSIPSEALFATAGRLEWAKLAGYIEGFLSDDSKAGLAKLANDFIGPVLGKGELPKVQKGLGPDWGFWITPPAKGETWPAATLAMKVQPDLGDTILTGIDFALQFLKIEINKGREDQFELKTEKHADGNIKYVTNDKVLPEGYRPAYAIRGEYLLLATSPEAIKRFKAPTGKVEKAPLARLNAKGLAEFIRTSKCFPEKDREENAAVLELFDKLELTTDRSGSLWQLQLKATMAKGLNK